MAQVQFREMVELFLNTSIYDLKSEEEVPKINIQFDSDGLELFRSLVEKPFKSERYWTDDAKQEDINYLVEHWNDKDCLTICVSDSVRFFQLLTNILNSLLKLYDFYGIPSSPRVLATNLMRRIWLRMGITDVENVELFLEKQLEFINNMTFDQKEKEVVSSYCDCDVKMHTFLNRTFDETTRSMVFTIEDGKEVYELPHILYDIDDNNTCYIYGVQNKSKNNSKSIGKKLYKLNKGIENQNVHPGKVCAMMLFIEQLKKKGITRIIVPGIQVLSYSYHELLSKQVANDLLLISERLAECPHSINVRKRYDYIKEWYDRLYEKQDYISYLKTEELYNLIYRMTEQDPKIEITNEVGIQGDSINLKI